MKHQIFVTILVFIAFQLPAQNADIRLLRNINENHRTPMKTTFYNSCSNSIYFIPLAYPIINFSAGKLIKNNNMVRESFFSIVSLGTTSLISYTLKQSIRRPRPYVTYPDIIIDKPSKLYSFPSGHTTMAFCTATSIALYYDRWYITLPAYAWACMVSTSRMYLGKHYPSDIIGGMVLGTAIPLIFHFIKPVNRFIDNTGKKLLNY